MKPAQLDDVKRYGSVVACTFLEGEDIKTVFDPLYRMFANAHGTPIPLGVPTHITMDPTFQIRAAKVHFLYNLLFYGRAYCRFLHPVLSTLNPARSGTGSRARDGE